ncbi:MAG: shikimate dehydrogenase [Lachnospiraceae bacterium]|nr:shikimate dehydrogenase [Lachnospiraceae bacterium]
MQAFDFVSGKSEVFGLIGKEVSYSLSPKLINTISFEFNKPSVYVPFAVAKGRLEEAVLGGYALNIKGFNVTVPYKQEVMKYISEADDISSKIGAVNTLKYTEKGYKGYNTDVIGIKRAFEANGADVKGKNVLILGAGGAAASAAFFAASGNAAKLIIANRTFEKAEEICRLISLYYPLKPSVIPLSELPEDEIDIVIQTTSLGMKGSEDQSPVLDISFFKQGMFVMDIIYSPWETRFLKDAKKAGAKTVNGFDMLVFQGIASYEIWHDMKIDDETAIDIRNALAGSLSNNIVLIGFMGSGKTIIGKSLARLLGLRFLDTDEIIESKEGQIKQIFKKKGEEYFREIETETLKGLLGTKDAVISTGGGIVKKPENKKILSSIGKVIYLKASPEHIAKNVKNDNTRPLLSGKDKFLKISKLLSEREALYEDFSNIKIEVSFKSIEEICRSIIDQTGE